MSIRIIIANDHQILRQGLRALLEKEPDMEVVAEAEDGHKTVTLVRKLTPHVVIMDVHLPNLNGIEATQMLRADPSTAGLRIVALTAAATTEQREQAQRAARFDGYITKPIDVKEFLATVAELLDADTENAV